MTPLTPAQRSRKARHAALMRWSKEDPKATAVAAMQAGRMAKYEKQVDPDLTLPDAERKRRALALRRAEMAGLAIKSAKVRARNTKKRQKKKQAARDAYASDARADPQATTGDA